MALMTGITLTAQKKDRTEPSENLHRYTAEESGNLHSKRLATVLKLTEEQQLKVRTLLTNNLNDKDIASKKNQNNSRNGNDDFYNDKTYKKDMKSILSEEQYLAWEKMLEPKNIDDMDRPKKENEIRPIQN